MNDKMSENPVEAPKRFCKKRAAAKRSFAKRGLGGCAANKQTGKTAARRFCRLEASWTHDALLANSLRFLYIGLQKQGREASCVTLLEKQ